MVGYKMQPLRLLRHNFKEYENFDKIVFALVIVIVLVRNRLRDCVFLTTDFLTPEIF